MVPSGQKNEQTGTFKTYGGAGTGWQVQLLSILMNLEGQVIAQGLSGTHVQSVRLEYRWNPRMHIILHALTGGIGTVTVVFEVVGGGLGTVTVVFEVVGGGLGSVTVVFD